MPSSHFILNKAPTWVCIESIRDLGRVGLMGDDSEWDGLVHGSITLICKTAMIWCNEMPWSVLIIEHFKTLTRPGAIKRDLAQSAHSSDSETAYLSLYEYY